MKVTKIKPLHFLLTLTMVFVSTFAFSQNNNPPPPAQQGPVQAPIDGGLAILLVAGAAYGIKKSIQKD